MRIFLLIFIFNYSCSLAAQELSNIQKTVKLEDIGGAVVAKVGDRPVLQYNYKNQMPPAGKPAYYQRSGFIHPVYTPDGDTITEGFPEAHTHHHGIFNAWVNTEFKGKKIDFWNQQDETGTVVFKEILSKKEEKNFAELKTKQQHLAFINKDTVVVLEEIWTITVYNSARPFIWEIAVEQKNIADADLTLKKYHYGGMAFRGRDEWNSKPTEKQDTDATIQFLTSEGKTREAANHSRPEWVSMYGSIDGKATSLSIIPDPGNFRAPEFVRIHPDMPYFCFTLVVGEGFTIKPGASLKTKYCVITADREPSPDWINSFRKDFKWKK